jgi:hypothetical protein
MATNWEFIPGSFCGMYVRVKSATRSERKRRQETFPDPIKDDSFRYFVRDDGFVKAVTDMQK